MKPGTYQENVQRLVLWHNQGNGLAVLPSRIRVPKPSCSAHNASSVIATAKKAVRDGPSARAPADMDDASLASWSLGE